MRNLLGFRPIRLAVGIGAICGLVTTAQAMGPPSLPTTFAGEAFTVAFAFTLPALLAGLYLLAKSVMRRLTLQRALVIATLTIAGGFAFAIAENRPDLVSPQALLKLAGR
jgi:hypothetical protein